MQYITQTGDDSIFAVQSRLISADRRTGRIDGLSGRLAKLLPPLYGNEATGN